MSINAQKINLKANGEESSRIKIRRGIFESGLLLSLLFVLLLNLLTNNLSKTKCGYLLLEQGQMGYIFKT